MSKVKIINLYNVFSDEMKENIRSWWKTNIPDYNINKKSIKKFKQLIFHEIIHYKIAKKHGVNLYLSLELEKAEKKDIIGFYYNASLKYNYPYKFNLPKYYPIFIFIEFKHFLFDFICDTFKLTIFTTIIYRLSKFLKCLIEFKVRN